MQDLQFDTAQLLQAASLAGINPADIPADKNPWTWRDGRAVSWQMAFRSINATTAQEAEVAHGPAISLALQAAMEGHAPWTNDLRVSWQSKDPLSTVQWPTRPLMTPLPASRKLALRKPPAGPNSPLYPNSFSANWPRAVRRQRAASGLKLA